MQLLVSTRCKSVSLEGNAVVLIVSIVAMVQGEIALVKANLLGTMLAHLLLGLGLCFFFGGLFYKEQQFNITVYFFYKDLWLI
jgi:calcium/proton exchanger cax